MVHRFACPHCGELILAGPDVWALDAAVRDFHTPCPRDKEDDDFHRHVLGALDACSRYLANRAAARTRAHV